MIVMMVIKEGQMIAIQDKKAQLYWFPLDADIFSAQLDDTYVAALDLFRACLKGFYFHYLSNRLQLVKVSIPKENGKIF